MRLNIPILDQLADSQHILIAGAGGGFDVFSGLPLYFTLREMPEHLEALKRVCAFDLIANNADRKGGHCLVADSAIYAIDNGLCFHVEPKLRTVIWDFAGQPVPEPALADLRRFVDHPMPEALVELIDPDECRALRARARALLRKGCFPGDRTGQGYPWPLV